MFSQFISLYGPWLPQVSRTLAFFALLITFFIPVAQLVSPIYSVWVSKKCPLNVNLLVREENQSVTPNDETLVFISFGVVQPC